jgi:hypothetical protein
MENRVDNSWRKSSYSGTGGGQCVEVGAGAGVLVRDTVDRAGAMLAFPADAWSAFIGSIR